jgi:hypothetical protein
MNSTFKIVRIVTLIIWSIEELILIFGSIQLFGLNIFNISQSKVSAEYSSISYVGYAVLIILIFFLLIYGLLKLRKWFLPLYWLSILIFLAPILMIIYIINSNINGILENLVSGIFGFIIPIGLGVFFTINNNEFKRLF